MQRIKFILFMVKLYFSILSNYVKIEEMNASIKELVKRRTNMIEMLILCKNVQIIISEHVQMQLSGNERSCAREQGRGSTFWEVDCQSRDDVFFKQNFRLTKSSFTKLCSALGTLKRKETNVTIPLEKRIAIALYALGSSSEYRSIANLFGVGKSTVCILLLEFCNEVWQVLQPTYLNHLPLTAETIKECVDGFNRIGFPQCLGALDGCHIEVHPKQEDAVDYMNYKGWYSTNLLALVDARYRFLYIHVGSPGRCNDSQIFENCSLKRELENCSLLSSMSSNLGDIDVPVVVLGDSAFRFSKFLMKPYPFSLDKTPAQRAYNYQHAKCRRVVENAFGQYKARFRRIGKGIDNRINNANSILQACCVLHNFLIAEKDLINPSWLTQENRSDLRTQPQTVHAHQTTAEAERIRNSFCTYFYLSADAALEEEADGAGGGDDANDDGESSDGGDDDGDGDDSGDGWDIDAGNDELWLNEGDRGAEI